MRQIRDCILLFFLAMFTFSSSAQELPDPELEKTTDYTYMAHSLISLGIIGTVLGVNFMTWGINDTTQPFHFKYTHFFSKKAHTGGIDKLGHMFMNYFFTRMGSSLHQKVGVSSEAALLFSSLTVFMTYLIVEISDGFTQHGFEIEDMVFNWMGMGLGLLAEIYPGVDQYFKFRVGYVPSKYFLSAIRRNQIQFFQVTQDYPGMTFYADFILPFMRSLTFGVNWATLGYKWNDDYKELRERYLGVHVGMNWAAWFHSNAYATGYIKNVLLTLDRYFSLPYTRLEFRFGLTHGQNRITFGVLSHLYFQV